jgi:hypothetical protein
MRRCQRARFSSASSAPLAEKNYCGNFRGAAHVFQSDENLMNFFIDSLGAADTL